MQNLLPAVLPKIEAHRFDVDTGPDTLHPLYEGYSLVNFPGSVARWLGAPPFGAQPFGPEIMDRFPGSFQHVILVVVDGFGLNAIQDAIALAEQEPTLSIWKELAERAVFAPLTSIAPSTTAAALTTLWTGCAPAEHGVVAYEVWLKEYGLIANMILHSPASFSGAVGSLRSAGFDPQTFLPVPTFGPHLTASGIRPYAFQHASIAKSGLSTMLLPGVEVVPFRSLSDLWVTLGEAVMRRGNSRTYTYIYWGELDEHSHRYGPHDERVGLELETFSRQLGHFIHKQAGRSRGDTLMIITADHGHIYTPNDPRYELRNHPELTGCMTMLPSGEARLPIVYLRPGFEQRFLDYLDQVFPGEFLAIPSYQAVDSGLFGRPTYGRFSERIGDYVLIPQGSAYWWFADRDNPLLGRHGGLSKTEMLAPFFGFLL